MQPLGDASSSPLGVAARCYFCGGIGSLNGSFSDWRLFEAAGVLCSRRRCKSEHGKLFYRIYYFDNILQFLLGAVAIFSNGYRTASSGEATWGADSSQNLHLIAAAVSNGRHNAIFRGFETESPPIKEGFDMEITTRPEPGIPGTDRIDVQRAGRGCDKPGELRRLHFRRYNDLERFAGLVHGLAMRLWILLGSQPSRLDAMARRVQAAAFGVLIGVFLCGRTGHAQDFTWSATPASGLWSNAANWSPNTGPPSVADTAIFGGSTVTSITLGGAGVNTMQFNAGAPAYSFTLTGPATFTIFGNIVNNSSNQPTFTLSATSPNVANLIFENAAANAIIINNAGGNTEFVASSTAANATITNNNGGTLQFLNTVTAGSATITTNSGGLTEFENQATGGSARLITNAGGTVDLSLLASGFTGMTAGSIEGAGTYALGGFTFTVGSNNLSTTVSGTIQGPGELVKVGTGTLTLTGTNTQVVTGFDGGVVAVNTDANLGTGILDFNGGTLEALAAEGGIVSSELVAVNAGGATFLADPATTSTLSGAMDGSGALTLTGSGTLILTGANSYGGGTTISGGTLQLGNGVKTGIIFGDVVNDAALVFDESSDVTFSGAISGTGT